MPPGVFNLVIGDGPSVGQAMSAHPDIDMMSFTGSTRAGIAVAQRSRRTVKRVCQELGGKSANIVLPDADLEAAARWNVAARLLQHRPVLPLADAHPRAREPAERRCVALLADEVARLRVGDPTTPTPPRARSSTRRSSSAVQRYIQIGLDEGARLVCGGPGRPEGLEPRLFHQADRIRRRDAGHDHRQGGDLRPGAVRSSPTRNEDEAVEIANDTPYGLGGYVFARDRREGATVAAAAARRARLLQRRASNTATPMGGYKQSGNGREMGVFGLEEYLEVKAMIGLG